MKGFIKKAVLTLGCSGALAVSVGCDHRINNHFDDLVDPCYPDRYMCAARNNVKNSIAPQVQNGHVLDQTVWDYHFTQDSAVLTNGGRLHLDYIARRRPYPDPMVFVQTAQHVAYDPEKPDELTKKRADLDTKRVTAVTNYLNSIAGARGVGFQVAIHDPGDPSISAVPAGDAIVQMYNSSSGSVFGGGGGGGSGTSATGGSSSGSGGGGANRSNAGSLSGSGAGSGSGSGSGGSGGGSY